MKVNIKRKHATENHLSDLPHGAVFLLGKEAHMKGYMPWKEMRDGDGLVIVNLRTGAITQCLKEAVVELPVKQPVIDLEMPNG